MKYELFNKANLQPHLDIESEIQKRQNGLFTFTLRTASSVIVDMVVTEEVDVKKLLTSQNLTEYILISQ